MLSANQVLPPPPSPPCTCGKILGKIKEFCIILLKRWNGTRTSFGAPRLGHPQHGKPSHGGEQGWLRAEGLQRHLGEQEVAGLRVDGQLEHLHDRRHRSRSGSPARIGLPGPVLQKWFNRSASLWLPRNRRWQVSPHLKTYKNGILWIFLPPKTNRFECNDIDHWQHDTCTWDIILLTNEICVYFSGLCVWL